MIEIFPDKATYTSGAEIAIEVRGTEEFGELTIWRLGKLVTSRLFNGLSPFSIGELPAGGYGIELKIGNEISRTAVEVSDNPRSRLRYGFVTDYSPERDIEAVSDNIKRLHLSGIQFYDWAYRHANLLGGGENYKDALNQPISLGTVRDLVSAVQAVGSSALGYAAVYAVGPDEWTQWKHQALLTPSGIPYGLGDFLFLLDPASQDWLAHFTAELVDSVRDIGFDGFHLDQYGYPKVAVREDGVAIDVSESFASLISCVRQALPTQHLVFNNVNDFPTWVSARSPQDAIYIEVWTPNNTLNSLASIINRAKNLGNEKPVVIAAYQHVYDLAPTPASDLAISFTMATLFSHGATQILAGESDRILVDPYYVRNHKIEKSTANLLKNWYDFLVEHDSILLDPRIVDVTSSYSGTYNDDCDVRFEEASVSEEPQAGSVWRRITSFENLLIVHLINLVGQENTLWDAPRNVPENPGVAHLRFRLQGKQIPIVRVADPDGVSRLKELPVILDGDHAHAVLPPLHIWQVVLIDLSPNHKESGHID